MAATGGLVAVSGADSRITSDSESLASIGEDVAITVGSLTVNSVHSQNFDSSADAIAFGLAAGTGAGATNNMTTSANVDIGVNSGLATTVTADAIFIKAVNIFSKEAYANSNNLKSGSAGLGTVSVLASGSTINSDAIIDIGRDTSLVVVGSNAKAGLLEIEAINSGTAIDSVKIESVSGFGLGVGLSHRVRRRRRGQCGSAFIENKSGNVVLAASTNSELAAR